jgi:peptidyl-Asp metalloendopeptidase
MKKLLVMGAILALGVVFVDFSAKVHAQKGRALFAFTETPAARPVGERSSIASVREADISIDLQQLSRGTAPRLSLPLFDGKTYEAVSTGTEIRSLTDLTWRGKIREGKVDGDVILTFRNGYVAGIIYAPKAVYEIIPKGDRQILIQLDQSLFPECAGDTKGDPAKSAPAAPEGVGVDSGDRIDVLVLYSTPVKNSLGGEAQAQAFSQSSIDITNTTYINSKIRQRVRMVGAQETAIAETGNLSTELSTLRTNPDAATARNTLNADLVAMLSNSSNACGIGNLMGGTGGNPANGFTVTSRTCAVGNLSFPHELGHNMASHHNPENAGSPLFPYGFGHYINGNYRTVMSYVDPCPSGCTRRPYFSNPNVLFNGLPTGIHNSRDNARSINNTADWIAAYRYSGSSLQMNTLNGGEGLTRGVNRTLTWSSDNITGDVRIDYSRDESTNWQTLVATTPNDGSEVIRIPGMLSRRFRVRIVSLSNTAVSDSSVNNHGPRAYRSAF